MRHRTTRGLALTAVAGLLLAGCGGDGAQDDPSPDDQAAIGQSDSEQPPDDLSGDGQQLDDPNDDIEDGVYRGNGVALPVPDGWSVDPAALSQGVVAAVSEDGTQQLTAQAIDTEDAAAAGQDLEFDTLLDGVREQIAQEAEVDEEVELAGAERAHRLTYLALPSQQQGAPPSSATIVLAEDGQGLIGEFAFSAATDAYDEAIAELLLGKAGFDPDSEPPSSPQPPPQGEGGTTGEQPTEQG